MFTANETQTKIKFKKHGEFFLGEISINFLKSCEPKSFRINRESIAKMDFNDGATEHLVQNSSGK